MIMKNSVYRNLAVTACSLGLLGSLVGCLGMSVTFESTNPNTSSPSPDYTENDVTPTIAVSSSSITPTNQVEDQKAAQVLSYRFDSSQKSQNLGTLRMSNQTNQPVRLALLARQSTGKKVKTHHDIPAHWDFAPQEGSEKGLLLSLPQGSLKLEKGDILVAFAQDGSRRYWVTYVVGETPSPSWNTQSKEWQLILNP